MKHSKKSHKEGRGSFSGRIGYVLAVAGSAVGLGNIWRFPYLAAKYGGGIFLLVYLLLTVSFGYVLIMSETALGRMTKKSPVGAFASFGNSFPFKLGGWLKRKCAGSCTGWLLYRIHHRFFSNRTVVSCFCSINLYYHPWRCKKWSRTNV